MDHGGSGDRSQRYGRLAELPRHGVIRTGLSIVQNSTLEDIPVSLIRFTIADPNGTTSFTGPGHAIKLLVAGCTKAPGTIKELLAASRQYDEDFVTEVLNGLSVFDEHNTPTNTAAIEKVLSETEPGDWPPFRVYNDVTRRASTQPARAGLIVINLGAKRIIQVQNSYAEIQRQDRGRIRASGKPTRILYHYDWPSEWSRVP
jgi:hypothetical protein